MNKTVCTTHGKKINTAGKYSRLYCCVNIRGFRHNVRADSPTVANKDKSFTESLYLPLLEINQGFKLVLDLKLYYHRQQCIMRKEKHVYTQYSHRQNSQTDPRGQTNSIHCNAAISLETKPLDGGILVVMKLT